MRMLLELEHEKEKKKVEKDELMTDVAWLVREEASYKRTGLF